MKRKPRTHKSASKRFKITGTGKVMFRGQGIRHRIKLHKSKSLVRRQRRMKVLTGAFGKKIKQLLRIA